jgi:hypothetical protein
MRVKFALFLAAIVCLFPIAAAADITRISPQTISFGDVEGFLTVFGSGLSGTQSTFVVYDGPAGQFFIQPGNFLPGPDPEAPPQFPDNVLTAFIPIEVATTPGPYVITVVATNVGEEARTIGQAIFNVSDLPLDGPPIIAYTETVYQEATSSEGAVVNFDVSAQNPNGDPVDVTCSHTSGMPFSFGLTTVTCSASNLIGTTVASFSVIVADSTNPIVTVPANINSTSPVVTYEASAVDNIDGPLPVTCTPASGSTFAAGVNRVVCTATDSHDNTGVELFFVILDGGQPVITVPGDITVTSPDGNLVEVPYTVTATNDGAILCLPAGNSFAVGTTTITCTATNLSGSDSDFFTVRVLNGAAPELTVSANITAEAMSPAGAVVLYGASATNDATIVCSQPSGSTFPLGVTTVSCTATNAGGSDTDSFTITVVDTRPPVLMLDDVTAEATSASGAAVVYVAAATDLVDTNVDVQCTPASGSTFALGTTLVSCTATDDSDNSATDSFNVTVVDSTPPQILSVEASPNVLWPPNHKMANVTVTVVAIDLVDPTPVSRIISVTSNQPTNGTGDGDTPVDWIITGPLTLQLRAERSHGIDRTYTITVESRDDAGNASTATETVVVSQGRRRAVH